MTTDHRPLLLGVATLLIACAACADDITQGGAECPPDQAEHPITGDCQPCPEGQEINPIQGVCQPTANASGGGTSNNQTDNHGGGGGVWNSSANNDTNNSSGGASGGGSNNNTNNSSSGGGGGGGGGTPPDPTDYEPFQPQDPTTAEYFSCESDDFEGLTEPLFILNGDENYILALPPTGPDIANIQGSSPHPTGQVFTDGADDWTGFVLAITPGAGQNSASAVSDWAFNRVATIGGLSAARQGNGYTTTTHDGFSASILNHVSLTTTDDPSDVRDQIVGQLANLSGADLNFGLSQTVDGDGSGVHLVYQTVFRGPQQAIVVGGLTTTNRQNDPSSKARFAIQDIAGGTALAMVGDTLSDQCVSREVHDTSEVDIIIAMDASGSMGDVQSGLINFADDLVDVLNNAGVDWRVGVTGVDCDDIRDDEALSPEFRALWPDPDEWESSGIDLPFPDLPDDLDTPCKTPGGLFGIGSSDNNGRLMQGTFTTSATAIADRLGQVSTTGLEYTLTMGIAAIDHSLPRAANAADKIRPNAAVVVIAVTDENEQLFKDAFGGWITGGNDPISASERADMEAFIQPWLEYVNRPDINATLSGLYWVPGTSCDGGEDVAHGIHYMVEQTGGQYGSICDPDIGTAFGNIAEATQDLANGLYLVGKPYSGSIAVDRVDLATDQVSPMARHADDGFDFDTTNNSLFFAGPSAPTDNERVVVPYLQWDGTVISCTPSTPCPNDLQCVKGTCE